jgi:hypothetical protein
MLAVLNLNLIMIMNQEDIAKNLTEVFDSIEGKISSLDGVKRSSKEVYLVSYLSTILQFGRSIAGSIKSDNLIAVAPLLRSQLEAFVELINLCKHQGYYKVLYAIHLEYKIKMIEATFKDSKNSFFKDTIEQMDDRGESIKNFRMKLEDAKKDISDFDGNYKQIKSRFKYAGLEPVYSSIYKLLCQDTHNDLLKIEDRHFYNNNGTFEISTKVNWPIGEVDSHILTTLAIVESSVIEAFPALGYEKPNQILEMIDTKHKVLDRYFAKKYR